ncbi:MAG: AraC family transcriptional regulator [Pseudomonadota bacterium]
MSARDDLNRTSDRQSYRAFYRGSAYARFPREERSRRDVGVDALLTHQSAHDFTDPPTSDLVIGLTLSGRTPARWCVGGRWREISERRAGCIGVSPLDEPVEMSVCEQHSLLVVGIARTQVRDCVVGFDVDAEEVLGEAHRSYYYSEEAARGLRALWSALGSNDRFAGLEVDGLVRTVLASCLRMRIFKQVHPINGEALDCARLEEFIRAHIDRKLSVQELSTATGLPVRRLSNSVRARTGKTPYQLIQSIRVSMAADMLLDRRLGLADIASALGYADQAHFSREFKRAFGHTPSARRSEL